MSSKSITVCFSGHRVLHDPKTEIEKKLEAAVRECISKGAERFLTGGALGFDTPVFTPYQHSNTEFNINARFIGNRHNLNHR